MGALCVCVCMKEKESMGDFCHIRALCHLPHLSSHKQQTGLISEGNTRSHIFSYSLAHIQVEITEETRFIRYSMPCLARARSPKAVSRNCTSEGELSLSIFHLMKVRREAGLQKTIKKPIPSPPKKKKQILVCLRTL